MNRNDTLVQTVQIVQLLAAAADAAGRTSAIYASLKHCVGKAKLIVEVNQAAVNVNFNILQGINVAGGSSKAAPASALWQCTNTANNDAFIKQTDAINWLALGSLATNKIAVFEIDPLALDRTNGFDCIGISSSASNVGNITSARILIPCGYQQTNVPSAIAD